MSSTTLPYPHTTIDAGPESLLQRQPTALRRREWICIDAKSLYGEKLRLMHSIYVLDNEAPGDQQAEADPNPRFGLRGTKWKLLQVAKV